MNPTLPGSRGPGGRAVGGSTPLKLIPGVGPRRAEALARMGLETVRDLLHHFPRRYEDRRKLRRIAEAVVGETQVLYGELASVTQRELRGGRSLIEAWLVDVPGAKGRSGSIELIWFNQGYLLDLLRPGSRLHAYGQVKLRRGVLQMPAPEFELDLDEEPPDEGGASEGADVQGPSPHMGRIVPIYPLTKGVHQRFLRGLVSRVTRSALVLPEGPYDLYFPGGLSAAEAFSRIHFPGSWKDLEEARKRLTFEEYFAFASHLAFRRQAFRGEGAASFGVTDELDRKIRSVFPFAFTPDQDRAVAEIVRDLKGPAPTYRLLQGDVGTGKTAVAIYAMLVAVRNGHQAALMAPTEILAEQHHRTISSALARYPVRVELLTSSVRGADRRRSIEGIATGKAHIVVGTHALVQEGVEFKRLGLAVIDEQHRFGVLDRMRMRRKGRDPHVLVMTATPIPRSLCLTCYGDMDLSLLERRPAGRQPVKTFLVKGRDRPRAMELIRRELAAGRQAYFVYPLIDESEVLALPAAIQARERLGTQVFPEHAVGLVHGDMPAAEKESELALFRRGEIKILVATVVVEVGIDVPNATVLFIEDASRFGLAQLHQLRGRVGRGEHPGCCLVGADGVSREVLARLRVFASTEDGFVIAEEDLKLRGPGDFLGVRQSGRPHFLLGNPLEDLEGFLKVKSLAEELWRRPDSGRYRELWAERLGLAGTEAREGQGFVGLD
ncbi:MAG: ATP-dependent DNA helicase RecG [Planctomycetes bacterium]|nr:ATP-dependent DNA helicase RecG [Planctomycetota bacterium]